jgi:hypothetical protein
MELDVSYGGHQRRKRVIRDQNSWGLHATCALQDKMSFQSKTKRSVSFVDESNSDNVPASECDNMLHTTYYSSLCNKAK